MILHIDGDILKYRIGFATNNDEDWICAATLDTYIEGMENAVEPDEVLIHISGTTNFRNDVAVTKPYKGNRKNAERPVHYDFIHDYLIDTYPTRIAIDEEADDTMAYMHMEVYEQDPYGSVIATCDKDLDMIPGLHYNFVREHAYVVTQEEADRFFQMQLLTGDSTDNIPGVPKMGPKKAAKLLLNTSIEDAWRKILIAYRTAYGETGAEVMLEQGQLLWIRRKPYEMWELPECLN